MIAMADDAYRFRRFAALWGLDERPAFGLGNSPA